MSFSVYPVPVVLLIDRDPVYINRLTKRLSLVLQVDIITSSPEQMNSTAGLSALDSAVLTRLAVVLADPISCRRIRLDPFKPANLIVEDWLEQSRDALRPYRMMPVSRLATWLRDQLAAFPLKTVDVHDGLTVAVDVGWSGHDSWLSQHLADAHQAGLQVIYLPLKPTYRMNLIHPPGQGPNLTALLLRLTHSEPISPNEIGHYLEPHPDGYWQFRPPERSDDVSMASLPAVRELVSLLRRRADTIRQETSQGVCCVVDIAELPLQSTTALAVLADQLAVRFESGDDFAGQSSQRELAVLLARLPSSCQILEMNHSPSESRITQTNKGQPTCLPVKGDFTHDA